jgi:hypothetical protein
MDAEAVSYGELKATVAAIAADVAEIRKQTTETNGRLRKVEERQASLKGGLVAASLGIPGLTAIIVWAITSA